MTKESSKAPPLYPKTHLLAASGIAALLSLALLVFPSSDVEAKKTTLSLELESPAEQLTQDQDAAEAVQATNEPATSPFRADRQQRRRHTGNRSSRTCSRPHRLPKKRSANHREVIVAKGDTLSTLFEKVGLPATSVHEVLASDKQAKQFSQLKHGQKLEFELGPDGQLTNLHSKVSDLESITLTKNDKGYTFNRITAKPTVRSAYVHGVINSSLSQSAARAGLSHSLTMDMASVFGYDVDFAQDIRQGDEFDVIYEQKVVNGKAVGNGPILSARFTNRGKTYTAVRYTNKQGNSSYYTADGNSMRKAFIRTPVDFARISSKFSMGRKHPILNKIRAHKGVDYAAPRGTPIKAAGDGKVLLAGRRGGYGNTVIIQHGNTYRTLYGHMQGFAKGVQDRRHRQARPGDRLHRHHRPFHRPALALRVPGQWRARRPTGPEAADGRSDRQSRTRTLPAQSQPLMARMDQEKATMLASSKR